MLFIFWGAIANLLQSAATAGGSCEFLQAWMPITSAPEVNGGHQPTVSFRIQQDSARNGPAYCLMEEEMQKKMDSAEIFP